MDAKEEGHPLEAEAYQFEAQAEAALLRSQSGDTRPHWWDDAESGSSGTGRLRRGRLQHFQGGAADLGERNAAVEGLTSARFGWA